MSLYSCFQSVYVESSTTEYPSNEHLDEREASALLVVNGESTLRPPLSRSFVGLVALVDGCADEVLELAAWLGDRSFVAGGLVSVEQLGGDDDCTSVVVSQSEAFGK